MSVVYTSENGNSYCGCMPFQPNKQRVVEYKLFKDKIFYRCEDELYETFLIPNMLISNHLGLST